MRPRVPSLAPLSGLRIRHCRELWRRLQTRLGSRIAMAVVWAGGYSSDYIPSLGTSICCGSGPRKDKKTKKKKRPWLKSTLISGFQVLHLSPLTKDNLRHPFVSPPPLRTKKELVSLEEITWEGGVIYQNKVTLLYFVLLTLNIMLSESSVCKGIQKAGEIHRP